MTDHLYPIPRDEPTTKFIFARSSRERDEHGTMLLAEPLSRSEREMVARRVHDVAPHLVNAKRGETRKVLLEVFPAVDDKDEAKKRVAQLAEAMKGLPLFAVRRAALKLSQAGVRMPDRVQLRTAAEEVARPHWDEVSVASMLLRARRHPGSAPGENERARIAAGFASLVDRLRAGEEDSAWGDRERRRRSKRMIRADRENRINDYRDEGVEPVFADEGQRIVVSLPLLERLGWTVKQVGRENVLVRPDGARMQREDRE
jgi:hypothetical protein